MTTFEAVCDCGTTTRHASHARAEAFLSGHVCPPLAVPTVDVTGRSQCESCTGWFPLLVDGALCISCDSLLFPDLQLAAIA